jgi:hypothetical protein
VQKNQKLLVILLQHAHGPKAVKNVKVIAGKNLLKDEDEKDVKF